MQAAEIEIQVRDLVVSKFAFGRKDQLRDEESLLEDHIDSSEVIETRNVSAGALRDFGIDVKDEDVTPENLGPVKNVAAFVSRKIERKVERAQTSSTPGR